MQLDVIALRHLIFTQVQSKRGDFLQAATKGMVSQMKDDTNQETNTKTELPWRCLGRCQKHFHQPIEYLIQGRGPQKREENGRDGLRSKQN